MLENILEEKQVKLVNSISLFLNLILNKLVFMLEKVVKRLRRKAKIRSKISGTAETPRLTVFRSNANIYAQLIDDNNSVTLASFSDLKLEKSGKKTEMATKVGEGIAKAAQEKNIKKVVFDRNGFAYHGRVKALADAARNAGLEF